LARLPNHLGCLAIEQIEMATAYAGRWQCGCTISIATPKRKVEFGINTSRLRVRFFGTAQRPRVPERPSTRVNSGSPGIAASHYLAMCRREMCRMLFSCTGSPTCALQLPLRRTSARLFLCALCSERGRSVVEAFLRPAILFKINSEHGECDSAVNHDQ
jgi:hypothetical protein